MQSFRRTSEVCREHLTIPPSLERVAAQKLSDSVLRQDLQFVHARTELCVCLGRIVVRLWVQRLEVGDLGVEGRDADVVELGEVRLGGDGLASLEAGDRRAVCGDVICVRRHGEGLAYVGGGVRYACFRARADFVEPGAKGVFFYGGKRHASSRVHARKGKRCECTAGDTPAAQAPASTQLCTHKRRLKGKMVNRCV
jgi:hypothetical protein